MKTHYTVSLAMLAGFGLGAVAVQGLRAQAKAPVYYISEIEQTDAAGYSKEYLPKVQAQIKAAGGHIVAGGKATSFEGAAPASRVVVQTWDSMEQIKKWRSSPEYKELRTVGDKYAKFRAFAVEGSPQ
jgi:uncharacterized protein (DUF1330 family)